MPFALPLALALALQGAAPGPQQDPGSGAGGAGLTQRFEGGLWVAELPAGWRQLGPEEAVRHRDGLEPLIDVGDAQRNRLQILGPVETWAAGTPARIAVLVDVQPFEVAIDQASLDAVVALRDGAESAGGLRQEVLSASLVELGPSRHPAIAVRVRVTTAGPDPRVFLSEDYYTSTSGQKLLLSLRCYENAEAEADPVFRAMLSSVIFARPPQEPGDLEDRLIWAVLFGGITGLALLVASILRRRTPKA
jgi:hypothetical protein